MGPGAPWAVFLDFDGTLADIAPRPDLVRVAPGLPETLARLRDRLGGALAIVTGRPLADVDGFLPGLRPDGAGLHGLERRIRGATAFPEGLRPIPDEVAELRRRFAAHPGVVIEDKRVGVAVHWRTAPDQEEPAAAAAAAVAARLGPGYRLQDGKAVREVVPVAAGKGEGIRALMAAAPYAGRRPLFAGDDRTDEDGFEAVEAAGGTGVKVGPGPTGASRRIGSAEAFREWLTAFAAGDGAVERLSRA